MKSRNSEFFNTLNEFHCSFLSLCLQKIYILGHRRSCYRDNGDKSPRWQGKELVYQEPESIEVLILIQGISSWCLEGYHFQINACPCLLLYERHFKPACLGLAVCLLQAVCNIPNSQLVSHTIVPKTECPKCCTNLYQEPKNKPSLENASATPMFLKNLWCSC